jgi:hypothetical protein
MAGIQCDGEKTPLLQCVVRVENHHQGCEREERRTGQSGQLPETSAVAVAYGKTWPSILIACASLCLAVVACTSWGVAPHRTTLLSLQWDPGIKQSADITYFRAGDFSELLPYVTAEVAEKGIVDFDVDAFKAKFRKSPNQLITESVGLSGWLKEMLGGYAAAGRLRYANNHGNFGDALIACSGFHLLKAAGLSWSILQPPEATDNSVIVYPGGGNLVPNYSHSNTSLHASISANLGRGNVMVVLPHTIDDDELVKLAGYEVIWM